MGDRVTGALIRWWGPASSPQEFHKGAAVGTMEARERDDPRTVATKPRRPLGPRKPRRDPRRTSPDSAQAPPWRELQTARRPVSQTLDLHLQLHLQSAQSDSDSDSDSNILFDPQLPRTSLYHYRGFNPSDLHYLSVVGCALCTTGTPENGAAPL
jgi:hypothetical protein